MRPRGAAAAAAALSCSASWWRPGARAPLCRKPLIPAASLRKLFPTGSPPVDGDCNAFRPRGRWRLDLPFPAERVLSWDCDPVTDRERRSRRRVQRCLLVGLLRCWRCQQARDCESSRRDQAAPDEARFGFLDEVAVPVTMDGPFNLNRGLPFLHHVRHPPSPRHARRVAGDKSPRAPGRLGRGWLVRLLPMWRTGGTA